MLFRSPKGAPLKRSKIKPIRKAVSIPNLKRSNVVKNIKIKAKRLGRFSIISWINELFGKLKLLKLMG